MKIGISFLKSNFDIKTTVKKIDESSADYIHVDLIDGKFVENKNFTISEIINLLGNRVKPLDIHLMVADPLKYIYDLAQLNTEFLTFHFEAVKDVKEVIEEIKSIGIKVGISIKPKTEISEIEKYLPFVDQVLVMSVEPGAGGQTFMDSCLSKIEKLKKLRDDNSYIYEISVDGGINDNTISLVKKAGVDIVAVGYYICDEENFDIDIEKLRKA